MLASARPVPSATRAGALAPVLLLVLLAALLLAGAPPAGAATVYGPARTVVVPPCGEPGGSARADAEYGGGRVRGFVSANGPCAGGRIFYVQGGSQGWTRTQAPYRGLVLAASADDVATYLLYVMWDGDGEATGLGVTKRSHAGRFFPTTVLSSAPRGSVVATFGDIASHAGRWWAVWTEQVGPGGEFAHTQLFQAGTVGAARGRTQRTSTVPAVEDSEPSLDVDAQGAVLAWTRQTRPADAGPSDVWVAVASSTATPWQRARALLTAGEHNAEPDVRRSGPVTLLGSTRDGSVVETDNSTGAFRSHVFSVRGGEPRVGVSLGSLFVAWTAGIETDASYRVIVARGNKGGLAFERTYVSRYGESLAALVAVQGRATVLVAGRDRVYSRTG